MKSPIRGDNASPSRSMFAVRGSTTRDLSVPKRLGELARSIGASERTLARLFRAEMGMTYPQWRNTIRVYQATVNLAEGMPISSTAHDCGWATPSAFIEGFRSVTGQTPRTYQMTAVRPTR